MEEVFEPDLPYDPRPAEGRNKLVFSNFLLTISTNVVPQGDELGAISQWLIDQANDLFDDFARLNGTVLKPAGSPNHQGHTFGMDHLIEGVRSRITLERGDQRGQAHMHVLLEVAHRYADNNQWNHRGVHVNAGMLRHYLNSKIPDMEIAPHRRPESIYVNVRLLTKMTDNQAKW